ncbi:divalent metal cation transporter MntH [Microlunatus endophyticus]|uniref:Divalent metal cation transporter MntH n=1 Tax=Microlunatus endophyticus TaxID=1716077 RepID=A0A917SGH3_9ACTN|nr:Nramp family divalent metal transporter [Microlunatus endophyticus]GGL78570.1 divalent metal cation transporter MntH [Microlunatus endophyticus]
MTRTLPERGRTLLYRSRLLGPAFVAAVAYVDPGNVATNTSAGAGYGYLLVWVLVGATLIAGLVQYLSAKVGLVTGRSLPELVGSRTRHGSRIAYWIQAELVAVATDLAEIIGGSVALQLLFRLPLIIGALITTAVSTSLLIIQNRTGQRDFERVISGLLAVVTLGFLAGLFVRPPDAGRTLAGLVPRLRGTESARLAVGMLGATVMPHVVYLHSALVRDRHGPVRADRLPGLMRATRIDVGLAMGVAGAVNLGMLLLSASSLFGRDVRGLNGAYQALESQLGTVIAVLFAVALLASGLASTSVGGYAGSVIMAGLLRRRIPILVRRLLTAIPSLIVLALGWDPTELLIWSQVILSFGIPFALVPLVRIAQDRTLLGAAPTRPFTIMVAWVIVGLVIALNLLLLVLTATDALK